MGITDEFTILACPVSYRARESNLPRVDQQGRMMLEPISSAGTRFIVLVLQVHMSYPKTEIFDREEPARKRWREAADAVVTGAPINDRLVTWARLYVGPAVGSKRDALRLASAGHLKLLETTHQADGPGCSSKLLFDPDQSIGAPVP